MYRSPKVRPKIKQMVVGIFMRKYSFEWIGISEKIIWISLNNEGTTHSLSSKYIVSKKNSKNITLIRAKLEQRPT